MIWETASLNETNRDEISIANSYYQIHPLRLLQPWRILWEAPFLHHWVLSQQLLLFHFFPKKAYRVFVRALKLFGVDTTRYGKNGDINLDQIISLPDYPPHYRINYKSVDKIREKASNCHASQLNPGNQSNSLLGFIFRLWSGKDLFTQAYPEVEDNFRSKNILS